MDTLQKIAVLLDADNTPASKLEAIFKKLSTYGRIVVKRAYGNWEKPTLSKWENETKRLAVKAAQQFDYTTGKNATDIAMVIDAMDLLHTGAYDAFALVSSDSDFTPLAIRLRESGATILGAGDAKTPQAFRNACDDFILLEGLTLPEEPVVGEKVKVRRKAKDEGHSDIEAIHRLLQDCLALRQHAKVKFLFLLGKKAHKKSSRTEKMRCLKRSDCYTQSKSRRRRKIVWHHHLQRNCG